MEEGRWSKLLPELLESISDRLPLHDYLRFRGVCQHWRSSPSGRSKITKFSKDDLWLLFYEFEINIKNDDGEKCFLYSKSHPDCCTIRLPHLRGATVVHSKFGWLLAHTNGQFFLYQPLSFEKIDLPKHAVTNDQVYTFTTLPYNAHCTIFIVSRWKDSELEVSYCAHGDAKWTTHTMDANKDRIGTLISLMCCCNCTACVCDCGRKYEILIVDEKKCLIYNAEERSVTSEGIRRVAAVQFDLFQETNDQHCEDWLHRFRKKGLSIACCAASAIKINPSTSESYGLRAWTEIVGDDDEEMEKYSLVKSAWIEPIFGTKDM